MSYTLNVIAASPEHTWANSLNVLQLANDAEAADVPLAGVQCIELHFPQFTDGRAYSQAFVLRRRLGFTGDLRATGDVLADQLQQMQRCGFSSAVLRADQNLATAQRQLARFGAFYQGDAQHPQPLFNAATADAGLPAGLPIHDLVGVDGGVSATQLTRSPAITPDTGVAE